MDAITPGAQDDTRDKLLGASLRHFADRGYYGASIAQIAGEVGLTKQALLYHFRRKEDLYGEVLKAIADRLLSGMRAGIDETKPADQQFEDVMLGIYEAARRNPLDTRVLMREQVDGQRKSAPENEWFFKTFIEEIVAVFDKVEGMASLPHHEKVARVYLALSSIEFFLVSEGTLSRFYGDDEYAQICRVYPEQLRQQVHHLLDK